MGDLTAAIRHNLDDPEHEDWCSAQRDDSKRCGCFLGLRTRALRAVLDMCDKASESLSGDPDDWSLPPDDVRSVIARELGVTVEVPGGQ